MNISSTWSDKDFIFDRMQLDSYIKDNRLYLEKLDLVGKDLTFSGDGEVDLQSEEIDLILFAQGHGLTAIEPSVLQSFTYALGRAVVKMEVKGNIYEPDVTVKTLPVIEYRSDSYRCWYCGLYFGRKTCRLHTDSWPMGRQ